MRTPSVVQPGLLSKMNERQVLRTLQARGPLSRAEVARHSGISAPTASKAIESLLRVGFLEEADAPELARGRPARKLRLASERAQVLGLVIDAEQCQLDVAGLNGNLIPEWHVCFPTPNSYEELMETAARYATQLMEREGIATLGLAVSLPGLVDYRGACGILSPNVPVTNQHTPARDLAERLEIPCLMVQESHALCLAERHFGDARGLDNFALMDVSTGVGLAVMSGGRLLTGHGGLAGEIGHITVEADGRPCGCGNCGCLETIASDSAFAGMLSQRIGRRVTIDEAMSLLQAGELSVEREMEAICRYLAIGVAAVINLFNPSVLFVHGKLFVADPTLFQRLVDETAKRALPPSFAECRLQQARGNKRLGAIAAMIEHLTEAVVPAMQSDMHSSPFA